MRGLGTTLTAVAAVLVSACTSLPQADVSAAGVAGNTIETGVSPTSLRDAVWLAAPRPGLSAVGKDYLFVGPMTVNRGGSPQSYLWFAVGTTIDRRLTGAPKPELETVVLVTDGTPMTFDLIAWDSNGASAPYPLTIDSYVSYAARVTGSQLRQLAEADTLEAYVTDVSGRSPLYVVVEGDPADWLMSGGPARPTYLIDLN